MRQRKTPRQGRRDPGRHGSGAVTAPARNASSLLESTPRGATEQLYDARETVAGDAVLTLVGLRRYFLATKAVDWAPTARMEVRAGEVHALLGENGAGKSTLFGIISGLVHPDAGEMFLAGEPFQPHSIADARELGVEIVLQEPGLVPSLTIAENFLLGRSTSDAIGGLLVRRHVRRGLRDALRRVAPHLGLDQVAGGLCLEDQKLVELARALYFRPRVLLVDEMSACLSHSKLQLLFELLAEQRQAGVAVVYISHYLEELRQHCDVVSILKDGCYVGTVSARTDPDELTRLMVGRLPSETLYRNDHGVAPRSARVLEVDGLAVEGAVHGLSFDVHGGEIVGIGGIIGCGSEEVGRALFGDRSVSSGRLRIEGRPFEPSSPRQAIASGVAYVPPNRDREGILLRASISRNVVLPTLGARSRWGSYVGRQDAKLADRLIKDLRIRTSGCDQLALNLSGGNRQKVVLAKWLVRPPKLLVLHNPTRGIDVGAKAEIYALMQRLAHAGTAIVLISDELQELIGMSDRIHILRRGRLTLTVTREEQPTEERLVAQMI